MIVFLLCVGLLFLVVHEGCCMERHTELMAKLDSLTLVDCEETAQEESADNDLIQ